MLESQFSLCVSRNVDTPSRTFANRPMINPTKGAVLSHGGCFRCTDRSQGVFPLASDRPGGSVWRRSRFTRRWGHVRRAAHQCGDRGSDRAYLGFRAPTRPPDPRGCHHPRQRERAHRDDALPDGRRSSGIVQPVLRTRGMAERRIDPPRLVSLARTRWRTAVRLGPMLGCRPSARIALARAA